MARRKVLLSPTGWRRLVQGLLLALFLLLFVKTDSNGTDQLHGAVNLLFRLDPFLALAASLAAKAVVVLMLPAVITLLLSLIFGRFFCGWVCPMGTLIDACHRLFGRAGESSHRDRRHLKYLLLFFLLTTSFFGLPLAGYLDPFSLLVRGLTFAVQPSLDHAVTTLFTWTYHHLPAWANALTEPLYGLLKKGLLPFNPKVYALSVLSLLLLLAALTLSRMERRFFCRTLCPLGALLALCSRISAFRLIGGSEECGQCRLCRTICRMGAIDQHRAIDASECILCLDCQTHCPRNRIHYGLRRSLAPASAQPLSLPRRTLLAAAATGALAPLVLPSRPLASHPHPRLIRPPGALPEQDFLGQCVRCGECMKVCIGNALHATWLEAGMEGVFSPRLIGRIGYCEYNCTLCGQVCPSGAIRRLTREEKHRTVIGRASFDKNRCLPYNGIPCIVCEEHCPTPDKAIIFREVAMENQRGETVQVHQPLIVEERCIGCGICENKCPLPGEAAVLVRSAGESRHDNAVGGYGS